jgi:hypothetical protein
MYASLRYVVSKYPYIDLISLMLFILNTFDATKVDAVTMIGLVAKLRTLTPIGHVKAALLNTLIMPGEEFILTFC